MKAGRTQFVIDPAGIPAKACAGLTCLSAAVRTLWFILAHGAGAGAYTTIVHFALPVLCCVFLALCVLQGKLRLAVLPVFFGCLFFILKALTFPSIIHTVLCCILYTAVLLLYSATVFGLLPTRVPLGLIFTIPFFYHLFVEDLAKLRSPTPPTLVEWMPEISVLLIMAGLACAAWGMGKAGER